MGGGGLELAGGGARRGRWRPRRGFMGKQPGMGKVSEREERVKEERIFNTKKVILLPSQSEVKL
jgi:hypothetical protein